MLPRELLAHGLDWATVYSSEAAQWNLRRTRFRPGYVPFSCAYYSALTVSGSSGQVRFQSQSPLLVSFSPATAVSAASSPRIFEAAMNLNVMTTC